MTDIAPTAEDESAHGQAEPIAQGEEEFFPGHPARLTTPEYRVTHDHLVKILDTPCEICGVRNSALGDPVQNPHKATAIETHHWPVQREYADACSWEKVAKDFSQYVVDQASFLKFVDSPYNMKVLCSVHHRDEEVGIHHATANDWIIQKYLLDGYVLVDKSVNAAADIAKDNTIVDAFVPVNERI